MFCFIHHRPCRKVVAESGKYKGELVYKCIIKNCRFVRPVSASGKTVKQRRKSEPAKSKSTSEEKYDLDNCLNETFTSERPECKEDACLSPVIEEHETDSRRTFEELQEVDPDFLPPVNRKTIASVASTRASLSAKSGTDEPGNVLASKRRKSAPAGSKHSEMTALSVSSKSPRTPTTITADTFGAVKGLSGLQPQIFFEVNSPTTFVTNRVGRHQFQIFEEVKGAVYDKEAQCWELPLEEHNRISRSLSQHGVTVSRIPRDVVDTLLHIQRTKAEPPQLEGRVPQQLLSRLKEYQKEGVRFALSKGGKCLIGDEMGLGKTVQALAVAACYRDDWPLLIICPAAVRYSWQEETMKWLSVSGAENTVINNAKCAARTRICIVSYDLLPRIALKPFKTVILDESHYIKNAAARRTKEIVPLLAVADHALLLTGTAALSRPRELLAQLSLLNAIPGKTERVFLKRYCNGHMGKYGYEANGSSHLKELSVILQSTVMIRRLKADVLGELPPKNRQYITLQCEESDALNEVQTLRRQLSHLQKLSTDEEIVNKQNKAVMMDLFRASAEAKIKAVSTYITGICASANKFLVFAHHITMLDSLEKTVSNLHVKYIRIDGKTTPERRKVLVDEFQTDSNCRVALLSITAAGTGITLSAAQDIIFAELYWTPGALLQCEDRAHRLGQRGSVTVRYLIAKGTVDEIIWPMIKHKLKVLSLAMDGEKREFSATKEDDGGALMHTEEQKTEDKKILESAANAKEICINDENEPSKSEKEEESRKWKIMDELEKEERDEVYSNRNKHEQIFSKSINTACVPENEQLSEHEAKKEPSDEIIERKHFAKQGVNELIPRSKDLLPMSEYEHIDSPDAVFQSSERFDHATNLETSTAYRSFKETISANRNKSIKVSSIPPLQKARHSPPSQGTQRTISSFFKKLPQAPSSVSSVSQRSSIPLIEKLQSKATTIHTKEFFDLKRYKNKDTEDKSSGIIAVRKRKRVIEDSDDIEDCSPIDSMFRKQPKLEIDSIEDPEASQSSQSGFQCRRPSQQERHFPSNVQNIDNDEIILIDSDSEGVCEQRENISSKAKQNNVIDTIDDFDDEIPSFAL